MIINDKEIKKLLEQKDTLVEKGRKITKEIEKLEKERNKCGLQIQKVKDKVVPMINESVKDQLSEFEIIERAEIKNGVVQLTIVDRVKEFKKALREQAKNN